MTHSKLFKSLFIAGFECSSHRRADGSRLDLLAATQHDRYAAEDYAQIARHGIRSARDGVRWHLIEPTPGHYDWSSFLPMLRAARKAGVQVIWDLCHYGWPDWLDIWGAEFVERFARFSGEAARIIREETGEAPFVCPVNEINYWAWAGGEVAEFNPLCRHRGDELKRQLVRTAIAAIEAVRKVDQRARFVFAEPMIHVRTKYEHDERRLEAEGYRRAQFQAYDMLVGKREPELGGAPEYLDTVGLNYYPFNQWYWQGSTIPLGHQAFRPMREMLAEYWGRYRRPMYIAETGAEGTARAAWLFYVCSEVRAAIASGVPVEGICLYPVLDYPGWDNGRVCPTGLFEHLAEGARPPRLEVDEYVAEMSRQQALFAELERPAHESGALAGHEFA